MEALIAKYGLSNEIVSDVKNLLASSIVEIIPCIIKEITPTKIKF